MRRIEWYFNRMQAMSIGEILWRVKQKLDQRIEKKRFYRKHAPVTEIPLSRQLYGLKADIARISMNWDNPDSTMFQKLELFGSFDYERYKSFWNAGFQTGSTWPEDVCSYDIPYSQRGEIGDIRTNWELNRHFQFSALAKSYYVSGDQKYFDEFCTLFQDWNQRNPFLHGVEWTSAMEIAVRVNSWIYTYCFLQKAFDKYGKKDDKQILDSLSCGILTMTEYIVRHRARYSSANNHLLVEMYAVGLCGILYDYEPWKTLALQIMTRELPIQNSEDGVNREMSLHYQCFGMEAYGLLALELRYNHISIPESWILYLSKLSEFLCDCCGDFGETVVFGDNDEGKILDLCGEAFDYYRYVLDLMGCILPHRYSKLENPHENLRWILPEKCIEDSRGKSLYISPEVKYYRKGGYTLIRNREYGLLMGIDHAELGFGSLAAHGHADALSIQAFFNGRAILVDPGTYNYHISAEMRNEVRKTRSHNTANIDGKDQGEQIGPFLWGRRYQCVQSTLLETEDEIRLEMAIKYSGYLHKRLISISRGNDLAIEICDEIMGTGKWKMNQVFNIGPVCTVEGSRVKCEESSLEFFSTAERNVEQGIYSAVYNRKEPITRIVFSAECMNAEKQAIRTLIKVKN